MNKFEIGQTIIAKNNLPLEGNNKAPKLVIEQEYLISDIILDSAGNQHLDVGIKSPFEFIRSWETKEELPRGDSVQWCHPSRFQLKS